MRLIALFSVSVAIGFAGYFIVTGPGTQPERTAFDSPAPAGKESEASRKATPAPSLVTPSMPTAARRPARRTEDRTRPAPPPLSLGRVEVAERRAEAAAARERLDRSDVRAMLEAALGSMLPDREFSEEEAERLTDAVLRIRAARRVLKRVPPSVAAADVLARERAALTEALADFQEVTGLDPSELTEILEPDGGLSNNDDPDMDSPEPSGDEAPEYLRDLGPPP